MRAAKKLWEARPPSRWVSVESETECLQSSAHQVYAAHKLAAQEIHVSPSPIASRQSLSAREMDLAIGGSFAAQFDIELFVGIIAAQEPIGSDLLAWSRTESRTGPRNAWYL